MEMKLTKLILCAVALAGLTATAEAQSGYTVAKDGDLFDYCVNNSSNSYKTFDKSLSLPAGVTAYRGIAVSRGRKVAITKL